MSYCNCRQKDRSPSTFSRNLDQSYRCKVSSSSGRCSKGMHLIPLFVLVIFTLGHICFIKWNRFIELCINNHSTVEFRKKRDEFSIFFPYNYTPSRTAMSYLFYLSFHFQPQEVITAVEKCLQEFGRIDIVINGNKFLRFFLLTSNQLFVIFASRKSFKKVFALTLFWSNIFRAAVLISIFRALSSFI